MTKKYALPNMEYEFDVQVTGEESGINWVGRFRYKRPTLAERSQIAAFTSRLNGDLFTLDADVRVFNEALAHLRFTLKEFPDWWKDSNFGADLYDGNVVIEVYNKCIAFEARWREKVHGGKPEEVEAENADKEPVGSAAGSSP